MQICAATFMRLPGDGRRVEVRVLDERAGGGQRVGAAAAHRHQPVVGLDHVARAGEQERATAVNHHQERLQAAQDAVGAPLLGQLDRRPLQVAAVLLELGLERAKRARASAAEPAKPARTWPSCMRRIFGLVLHHGLAEGHLAVAGEGAAAAVADGEDGGLVERVAVGMASAGAAAERLV